MVSGTPEVLMHYLTTGCWRGSGTEAERFNVFLLAGHVMRGDVDGLRLAWQDCHRCVKPRHRASTFAEMVLRGQRPSDCDRATRCERHASELSQ
jgi:hypothetical protein